MSFSQNTEKIYISTKEEVFGEEKFLMKEKLESKVWKYWVFRQIVLYGGFELQKDQKGIYCPEKPKILLK